MNKKLMLAVLVFSIMASLTFVSASLGEFKQGECVPIVTNLNSSSVNISVIISPAPNATILLSNVPMIKTGNMFNYTFCQTSKLGTYSYGYCDNLGNCYSNDFLIGTGGNIYLILILGVLAIILLVIGIYQHNEYLGLFSGFLFLILGIYSMIYGIGFIQDKYTEMVSYVLLGVGLIICFASIGEMYQGGDGDDD